MDSRKKIVIIIAVCLAVVVIIPLMLYLIYLSSSPGPVDREAYEKEATQIYRDPDTGDVLEDPLDKSPEGSEIFITLLGLDVFIDRTSIAGEQTLFLKDVLYKYGQENLKNAFDSISIIPNSIIILEDGNSATADIRLGRTDSRVELRVSGVYTAHLSVTISDKNSLGFGDIEEEELIYYDSL